MNVTMGYYQDPNAGQMGQAAGGLGSIAGAALGSVVPVIGPAIGGAAGGLLGGALGGLLGGKKKKQQMKIFPIGSKENPGWPGVGGAPLEVSPGGPPPNQGASALSGGINGLLTGGSMPGGLFGGGGGGGIPNTNMASSYSSPMLGTPGTPMTGAPGGGLSSYLQSLFAGGNRGF